MVFPITRVLRADLASRTAGFCTSTDLMFVSAPELPSVPERTPVAVFTSARTERFVPVRAPALGIVTGRIEGNSM